MTPEPGDALEAEGVLNPASGRTPDGRLHLLPRLVAAGNVSRVGLAEVDLRDGVPAGVQRRGVVLAPDEGWERGRNNAGVEDPRTTWMPSLGRHLMTYVAYGPLGPRLALAVSTDLRYVAAARAGPVRLPARPGHRPEPVPQQGRGVLPRAGAGTGRPARATRCCTGRCGTSAGSAPGEGVHLPAGVTDERPGIWISYVPADEVARRPAPRWSAPATTAASRCREFPFEELKIGAGPPPLRVPEGWLLIHHGVTGYIPPGFDPTGAAGHVRGRRDAARPGRPGRVLARTAEPMLVPETEDEHHGTVPNVVFPTAIEEVDGVRYVFYGMADAKIGVARLDRLTRGVRP